MQVRTRMVPSCVERLRRMTSRNICGPPRPDAPVPPSPVLAGATSASSTVAAGLYARSFAAMPASSPCRSAGRQAILRFHICV